MSIESCVRDSFELIQRGRFDSAMSLACAALDATAKNEFGGNVGERWTAFVNANLDIITHVGFGGAILSAPGANLHVLDPETPGKTSSLESIIYKSIRCNLLHEASLPGTAMFTPFAFYGIRENVFYIPAHFIHALLLVVVGAKSNAVRSMGIDIELNLTPLRVNELWGKSELVRIKLGIVP